MGVTTSSSAAAASTHSSDHVADRANPRPASKRASGHRLVGTAAAVLLVLVATLTTADATGTNPIPYNMLRQKSSHNSYLRAEPLIDQLQYHRVHSLELDIYRDKVGSSTIQGDWFVYHLPVVDTATSCHRLSDCLRELAAWSSANPDHEVVTVWMDLKEDMTTGWARADLDALVVAILGNNLYTPGNLLQHGNGGATTLSSAVSSNGWPSDNELRGKFIFVLTDKGHIDTYASTNSQANSATCFRQCTATTTSEVTSAAGYCVFFNQNCDGTTGSLCQNVYSVGKVCRCYRSSDNDDSSKWADAVNKRVAHIATDQVNRHTDLYTNTFNANGYPFESMDTGLYTVNSKPYRGQVLSLVVDSGDIWGDHDDFALAYQSISDPGSGSVTYTWTTMVNNAHSHIDDHIKGGLMVRQDISSKNRGESSRYFAVLRQGSEKMRVQYRDEDKWYWSHNTFEVDVDIPPTGDSSDQENRCFLRLTVTVSNGSTIASGYGSRDGHVWTLIKTKTFSGSKLLFQGIAGSSHGDTGEGGEHVRHAFTNLRKNGSPVHATGLTLLNVGNDVTYKSLVNGPVQN